VDDDTVVADATVALIEFSFKGNEFTSDTKVGSRGARVVRLRSVCGPPRG